MEDRVGTPERQRRSSSASAAGTGFELRSQTPSVSDLAPACEEIQGAFKTVAAPADSKGISYPAEDRRIDEEVNLKAALQSLETADHVCHELRKPMAVIHAYAELLVDEIPGPLNEKQKGYVEIVHQSVQRLDRLISDLFETFRVVSGSVPQRDDPQDLEELCHEVVAQLAPSCGNRSVRLAIRSQGRLVHPGLDAARLRSALARLIENALRFADDNEELVLSLARRGDRARFELQDPGPCLSQEEMLRIFELMYRPERDLHEPCVPGAGLGICRVLVESLGGRIWAEDRPDQRTTFVLELPLGESRASGEGSRRQLDGEGGTDHGIDDSPRA